MLSEVCGTAMSMRPAATAITSSTCTSGNQRRRLARKRREQAADADPEEARQQDEVREVREQADVGRHPPDQRDLEEQDEEGNQEEGPGGPPLGLYHPRMRANISGATIVASDSMMNLGVSMPSLPQVIFSFGTAPE